MNLAQWIVTGALRTYKCVVSPVLHTIIGPFGGCRFHPTCSVYAREAIVRHGIVRGGWLTTKRLRKCHPWGSCGEDPVPEVRVAECGPTQPNPSLSLRG
jgi:putative membrane protein insertion efficiency factor